MCLGHVPTLCSDLLVQAATEVGLEQSRALIAAKNAEIRRAKTALLSEAVRELEKKVKKGRGVTKQLIEDRQQKVRRCAAGASHGTLAGVAVPLGPAPYERLRGLPYSLVPRSLTHALVPMQIKDLIERIYAVPDGMSMAGQRRPGRVGRCWYQCGASSLSGPPLVALGCGCACTVDPHLSLWHG